MELITITYNYNLYVLLLVIVTCYQLVKPLVKQDVLI